MTGFLDRLADLFDSCRNLPEPEREAFVDDLARADADAAAELRLLLAADRAQDSVLDQAPEFGSLSDEPELDNRAPDAERHDAPAPSRPELIGATLGSFRIVRKLGEGSMAEVFEAEQSAPRRLVAIKVLQWTRQPGTSADRFATEVETLARLDHPNIARIYGAGSDEVGGQLLSWLAMELVAEPLPIRTYCERHELPRDQRLALFRLVCDAVQHAHRRGFLHRDLKPANVLVGNDGSPRVIDFGIARLLDDDRSRATGSRSARSAHELHRTQVGELVGTVLYMSPEQARGEHDQLEVRSDVFSLGVILFELLLGRHPFLHTDEPILSALGKIRSFSVAELRAAVATLPRDLGAILSRCLQPDRERRYDGTAALRDDLDRYLASEPVEARRPDLLHRLRLFARRQRRLCAALAVLAVLLVAGVTAIVALYVKAEGAVANYQEAERRVAVREQTLKAAQGELVQVRMRLGDVGRTASQEVVADSAERLLAAERAAERRRVVGNAFEQLERLRATLHDDPDSQASLIAAYLQVGRLIGEEWFARADDASVVQAALERGVELARREAVLHPSIETRGVLRSALVSYIDNCRKRSAFDTGGAAADECVAVARALAAAQPESERAAADLCIAMWARSDLVIDHLPGHANGLVDATAALTLAQELQQRSKDPSRWRSLVGWSHFRVGLWLKYRPGRRSESLEHMRKSGDAALIAYRSDPSERHRQELRTQMAIEIFERIEDQPKRAFERARIAMANIAANGLADLPARLTWTRFALLACAASDGEQRTAMARRIDEQWADVGAPELAALGLRTCDPAIEMLQAGLGDREALRAFVKAAFASAERHAPDSAQARATLRRLRSLAKAGERPTSAETTSAKKE